MESDFTIEWLVGGGGCPCPPCPPDEPDPPCPPCLGDCLGYDGLL